MTGLPARYAGWMSRDLALGPGVVMAVLTGFAIILVRNLQFTGPAGQADFLACNVMLGWTTGALTLAATGGMVSRDFSIGHQRTLFAKPVSPPLYYLQRWLLGAVAVLVGAVPIAAAIGLRFGVAMPGPSLLARIGLLYLVLGGLVFLLSTLTRRDWLLALGILGGQAVMGIARSVGAGHGPIATILYAVLPPFHLLRLEQPGPHGLELVHVIAYGTALVVAALAVLQWRPLARGARQ